MKLHYIDKGSYEWQELQRGKILCDYTDKIIAGGEELEDYIAALMSNYYSNEGIVTCDTKKFASMSLSVYNASTNVSDDASDEVGFIEINDNIGFTPDGLIGNVGIVELEYPSDELFMKYLLNRTINSTAIWKIQSMLFFTGRYWCDYVLYNPNFENSIIVSRVYIDNDSFGEIRYSFNKALSMIENLKSLINTNRKGIKWINK